MTMEYGIRSIFQCCQTWALNLIAGSIVPLMEEITCGWFFPEIKLQKEL